MKVMKEISEEKLALDNISEKIIGCAYQVSNTLGSGFSESVYEKSLHHQALKIGLKAERQYQMKVYRCELVVQRCSGIGRALLFQNALFEMLRALR